MRILFALALTLLCVAAQAQGFGTAGRDLSALGTEPTFLPVEKAYQLEVEVTGERSLRLYWLIADGYYLYQHSFKFSLEDSAGPIALDAQLPAGLEKTDEYFGDVVVHYRDADVSISAARTSEKALLSIVSQGCADAGLCYPPYKQYFNVDFSSATVSARDKPDNSAAAIARATAATTSGNTTQNSLLYMLLLAFVGGAILNLMPCVFPILSLKVLSFTNNSNHDRHLHSWVYTAGVIASFVAVAGILIALQHAGQAIGWGFQLQSPGFVIALAYLFIAMGLSLSGVVELGGNLMNTGSGLANRGGLGGSFFTGVLAVIVASPCTAPFMGTALGFAISQPAHIALVVFAALGAGMAAPLLLFSYSGAARKLMPRPGPWMETLKEFLAFPLYATALWLLWVAGRQTGINTLTVALAGALMLALGLWLWDHRAWRRGMALACLCAAIALGSVRGLDPDTPAQVSSDKVAWSDHGVAELRRDGKPVFVDVTADWCITCKVNEAAVLLTDEVSAAFAASDIVYMVADWTNHNAAIAELLKRHNRNGIPLYLMYPANSTAPPLVLPQILTKQTVYEAIDAVSTQKPEVAPVF